MALIDELIACGIDCGIKDIVRDSKIWRNSIASRHDHDYIIKYNPRWRNSFTGENQTKNKNGSMQGNKIALTLNHGNQNVLERQM